MLLKNFLLEDLHSMRYFPVAYNFDIESLFYHLLPSKVIGQLGMWGLLISGIQAALIEYADMHTTSWNGATSEPSLMSLKIFTLCYPCTILSLQLVFLLLTQLVCPP